MKADLDTRLAQFKTNLENIVNNYAVSTLIPYMNSPNTDERYAKMKAIFTAMAVAQWYKQKTNNNPTLPYSAIVDTQQMDNISREGTFDRSYWDNQAFNTIVRKP